MGDGTEPTKNTGQQEANLDQLVKQIADAFVDVNDAYQGEQTEWSDDERAVIEDRVRFVLNNPDKGYTAVEEYESLSDSQMDALVQLCRHMRRPV